MSTEPKYSPVVAGNYYLQIRKFRCLNASDLSWLQLYVSGPYHLEHFSTGYSIEFPAESKNPGTLAVGAAKWSTPGTIQSYSSRGPTTDGRIKPEIVGADCGKANFYSEAPPGCWFPGTSQAASHVSGMAALVKDRFPDYSPEQTAIYLKGNAEQRVPPAPDNTDPNNIWGHGFALLPDPADIASLSPVPSQITKGQSPDFTLSTNVPASTGVRVAVNYPEDTGNLAISSLGAGVCNGSNDYRLDVSNNKNVSVTGCKAGTAQVRLYKGSSAQQDTLLQVYTVQVVAPIAPPTNLSLSLVPGHNDRLRVNYARSGPTHNYQFELSRRNYGTGIYSPEITIEDTDGTSPATFQGVNRGYWYKARGRNCSDNTHTACGAWSSYTSPVELSDPGITISGLDPSMTSGGNDPFRVALSDATLGQQYTVSMSTNDDGLGFNASCLQTESRSFTPVVSIYNRNFTLYACDTPGGTVTAQLRKDGASGNLIDTDTFSVTVTASTNQPSTNTNAPSANAGNDKTVATGAAVSLFGTGSPANDDNDVTYNWTQQSGTTVSLKKWDGTTPYAAGLDGSSAKFTAPSTAGTLIFRLTVTDAGTGLSSWDELAVTVQ